MCYACGLPSALSSQIQYIYIVLYLILSEKALHSLKSSVSVFLFCVAMLTNNIRSTASSDNGLCSLHTMT